MSKKENGRVADKPTVRTEIQIRFADIDILGHVNNVNQQHYFDVGKHDFFRDVMGVDMSWHKVGIITAATNTSYISQTCPEDRIYVETSLEKVGTKSFTLFQRLLSHSSPEVKTESQSVMVAFDFEKQTSVPIPESWFNR